MAIKPLTVTTLNNYLESILLHDPLLSALVVEGEIGQLNTSKAGHKYFTLKDMYSEIECVIWSDTAKELKDEYKAGDHVVITGKIKPYTVKGNYKISVNTIELKGKGKIISDFEKLKEKLRKEGLFEQDHKKPIPEYPKMVGIVTSGDGAAVHDITETINNRSNKSVPMTVFSVPVQGQNAGREIAETINFLSNNYKDSIDTLILARGGGSSDDLSAFSEEIVVRAVYNCEIPIITAIGHAVDKSLADGAADVDVATPTAAAERAVLDHSYIRTNMEQYKDNLERNLRDKIKLAEIDVEKFKLAMDNSITSSLNNKRYAIENAKTRIEENNPYNILSKGYAVVSDLEDGKKITSIQSLKQDVMYNVRFKDGDAVFKLVEIGDDSNGK